MSRSRMLKRKFSKAIEKALHASPFSWPLNSARAYSLSLRETYFEDGEDPIDALNEDRTYWN